jgi:hypothetical protein
MKRRTPRDLEKERADQARQLREWKAWHREQLDEALSGSHGAMIAALVALLNRLELSAARTLVEFVQQHDWSVIDYATRLVALHEVGQAITRLRERKGLLGLDDPIPFLCQPDNAFWRIKQILLSAAPPGAHAGLEQTKQPNNEVRND